MLPRCYYYHPLLRKDTTPPKHIYLSRYATPLEHYTSLEEQRMTNPSPNSQSLLQTCLSEAYFK